MTELQARAFLDELAALCDRYGVYVGPGGDNELGLWPLDNKRAAYDIHKVWGTGVVDVFSLLYDPDTPETTSTDAAG